MTTSGAKSRRDRMIVAIVVVVVLYAMAAALWFTGRNQAWANARKGYEKELRMLESEKALIDDRDAPRGCGRESREDRRAVGTRH